MHKDEGTSILYYLLICVLHSFSIRSSTFNNGRQHEVEEEHKVISVSLIDGECVFNILSKPSICIYNASIDNNNGAYVLVILLILLLEPSDRINHNYNEKYIDRV